jgi:5-methylcytosine-specific restriction endonuclease McrA
MSDTIPQDTPKKQCTACEELLDATTDFFYLHKDRNYLFSVCKTCYAKKSKAKREADIEAARAYKRENAAKHKDHAKEYRQANAEKLDQRRRAYYAEHKDERRAYERAHNKAHPDRRRVIHHNRKARQKAIPGSYTAQDVQDQLKRQKKKCYWCHEKLTKYHVDHIVPVTREGSSNGPDNLVLACPTCNTKRGNKLPHEWSEGGRLL